MQNEKSETPADDKTSKEDNIIRKLKHGQNIRIGDEVFKVYRIGKNVNLKFLGVG